MSEESSLPVTPESALNQPRRGGTVSLEKSPGQGIRLTPVRAGLSWQFLDLPPGHYTVGARADADIVVDVPGVAERHCTLIIGTQRNVIKAWTNRTWINDGAVSEGALRPGDRLILGPVELKVTALTQSTPLSGRERSLYQDARQELPLPVLSEADLTQLLASPPLSDDTPAVSSTKALHQESHLQELKQEIEETLRTVLQKEHENRELFDRERLLLSQRTQELNAQWQQLERVRDKLQKHEDSLQSTADTASLLAEERRKIDEQTALLTARHDELASRSRSLVELHHSLKEREQNLNQKLAELNDPESSPQLVSVRSLLARNEAQSRQLSLRQKELDHWEEALHQLSTELTDTRNQLQEQSCRLENEERKLQGKAKHRERLLDDLEFSLTSRIQEVTEEELRQQARSQELDQREQELDHRLQEIQLQQQGVDQATRLLEQQQIQFASDDDALSTRKLQLEFQLAEIEATESQLQTEQNSLAQERDELNRRSMELDQQQKELTQAREELQRQQAEQELLAMKLSEADSLHLKLKSEQEALQIAQSNLSADQQNLQRLRNELDAERERDQYDREQISQSRLLLEQQQNQLDQQHKELAQAREELQRQQAELTFQLSAKASSRPDQTELSEQTGQLSLIQQELEADRQQLELSRQQLAEMQAQFQSDRAGLLEERDSLERRQNQIESARTQLSLEQRQLESLRNDVSQSRRELTSDQAELAEHRRRLHDEQLELTSQWDQLKQQREEWARQAQKQEVGSGSVTDSLPPSLCQQADPNQTPAISDQEESHPEDSQHCAKTEDVNSEGDAALRLRQQLANLFGIDPARSTENAPSCRDEETLHLDEPTHSADSENVPGLSPPSEGTETLNSLEEQRQPAVPVSSQSAQHEETSSGWKSADSDSTDDDSIAAYMERLLARTRRTSTPSEPAASQPSPPLSRPEPKPHSEAISAAAQNQKAASEATRQPRKMDEQQKKSIRNDLHSFREVANLSARTAVAKAHKTRKSNSLRYMIALNVVGWALTIGLFIAERWLSFSMRGDALLLAGISFCLTLLCLYRYKEIRRLSLNHMLPQGGESTGHDQGAEQKPESDSPSDQSGPLSFL